MLRLIFVRHGNTFEEGEASRQVGAKTDIPLTDTGRAQASAVASWLKAHDLAPTAVYSGNLKRQRETAEILSKACAAPLVEEADLVELDYGTWENSTIEELKARFPESYEGWNKAGKWPEEFGGSFEDARRHLAHFLEKIRCGYEKDACVVAVTSQGIMKLIVAVIEPERWAALQSRNEVESLKVATGALCEIELTPDGWRSVAWNVRPA